MLKRSRVAHELASGINVGRLRLAEQFGAMEGWQRQQDDRFDTYVKEKRQKEYFDAFDQRVERAFRVAAKSHKAEVMNAFKRKVKAGNDKWTAAVMLEVKSAVEERLRWLRDVWTQVDADYRSNDAQRQAKAAQEISDALRGEPGAYMQWVYERKRDDRFLGPKEKATREAELSAAELPEVTEDEANRYHNLPLRMADVEYNVKSRFGVAGQQHWAQLQAAKDNAYEQKLDTAAKVYEQLMDQSARYDESRRTALLRSNVERVHQAQLRFKASMEMEKEREKLVEAHEAMEAERKAQEKADRIAALHEAAELRRSGATSEAVLQLARQRQLELHARRQAEYQLREREALLERKSHYLDMIEKFRDEVEMREGQEMLQPQPQPGAQGRLAVKPAPNVFGFMDADRLPNDSPVAVAGVTSSSALAAEHNGSSTTGGLSSGSTSSQLSTTASRAGTSRKGELWRKIEQDHYEDPFRTIHQARLDAVSTFDPVYTKHFPTTMAQGKKYSKQGTGEMAAGGDMDKQVLKQANKIMSPYHWGVSPGVVHDIDADGSNDYYFGPEWHVRDPKTGDVDWRYERKRGGAVFRGPLLYRMGAEREAADLGNASVDPSPATVRRFNPAAHAAKIRKSPLLPRPLPRASETPRTVVAPHRKATTPALPHWRSS
ncbi:putative mitochondrial hypothetical protein [Leptomonas pyrrhocoris]|uniref:Uncharacterized protein n=1 Tax=Leptomonas pyrrhocoris TaxID=157538 RepID=A0A0M9G9P9_LEPPY|nr:putative mitochondrial hypothetical protein [Leptomonas pyrrhocoris]KPA85740.1 putative mitochondrial hypothetical protein [Leptomonas pyrrhocoris]|eukprot:XP_015664179.1 putative mitochondrial hypothetical protein [Leptomonas pyrrhocoris]